MTEHQARKLLAQARREMRICRRQIAMLSRERPPQWWRRVGDFQGRLCDWELAEETAQRSLAAHKAHRTIRAKKAVSALEQLIAQGSYEAQSRKHEPIDRLIELEEESSANHRDESD